MNYLLISLIALVSHNAVAGLQTVRGPFWQTLFENEHSIEISTGNSEIKGECDFFEELALNNFGSGIDRISFEELDQSTLPSDMINQQFTLDFKLHIDSDLLIATGLSKRPAIINQVSQLQALDILPNYTQTPEEMRLLRSGFMSDLTYSSSQKSLTSVAKKLGLLNKAPLITFNGKNWVVRIQSKSIACDILAHRARLSMNALAEVKISLENQLLLEKYYNTVESIAEDVLGKSKSSQIRAALFGFKMARELMTTETSIGQIEKRVVDTLRLVFNVEEMEKSKVWTPGITKSHLSVAGTSTPVNVKVNLILNQVEIK